MIRFERQAQQKSHPFEVRFFFTGFCSTEKAALFHRHGFCEVAGFIHVAAALKRHIIGEQL